VHFFERVAKATWGKSAGRMNPRLDNLISWFAASVVVTAGVIFARSSARLISKRPKPLRVLPRATTGAGAADAAGNSRNRARAAAESARFPSQIPWRGWKDIVLRTLSRRLRRIVSWRWRPASSFYALVALFPAIAAGVSFYALFADAGTIGKHLSLAAGIVPAEVLDLLRDEITRIGAKSDGKLTFGFLPRNQHRAVERQCGNEGDLRRAQHHL